MIELSYDNGSENMIKNRKKMFLIIGLCTLIVLLGVAYAWFNVYREGGSHKLIAGDLYLTLTDGQDQINITSVYPMSTEAARSRNDNVMTFTVSGKNTVSSDIVYSINLNYGDAMESPYRRFKDTDLMFDLIEVNNNTETYLVDAENFSSINNRIIWVDKVVSGTNSEVVRTYKLRMWLSEDVIISDTDPNASYAATGANAYKNYYASVKVNVIGDFNDRIIL